jgi:O-methyltransferase involved in polyketide biosynthesis
MANKLATTGLDDQVAQTLFIPLYMKSLQSQKSNAFFSDPIACELIQGLDYDFSVFDNAIKSSVGCAIRSRYFDTKVAQCVAQHPDCVVVNLGCGLDTRYQRVLNLHKTQAQFYHLDLPEVIELREKLVPSPEQDIAIQGSLFDTEWMDTLKIRHPGTKFVFVAEGVLMYFEKPQVKQVLLALAERFADSEILFDATSEWMRAHSHHHDTIKYTGTRFELGMDDPKEIEQWTEKLKVLSTCYYSDFKEWKRAGILNYLVMKLIPKIRHANYLVHCGVC